MAPTTIATRKVRTFSKPTGTPDAAYQETTNFSPGVQRMVSDRNAALGLEIQKQQEAQASVQRQAQAAEILNPGQAAATEALANQVPTEAEIPVATEDTTKTDYFQAGLVGLSEGVKQGIVGAGAGAAAGATIGALGGTAVVPGVGTAVGAAGVGGIGAAVGITAGFIKGLYSGITNNIKNQKTDDISSLGANRVDGMRNMNKLIAMAKADPGNREDYVEQFNSQLTKLARSYSQLKLDSEQLGNKAMGKDATVELQRYENFYAPGGSFDILTAKMRATVYTSIADPTELNLILATEDLSAEE